MSKALVIENINKTFRMGAQTAVRAVSDVSLAIVKGEFFSLLGPSGCGKTTLLRMIAGFEKPDSGNIFLFDEPIVDLPAHKRPVNTVFQNYALFPHMTVFDNVAFGPRMQGKGPGELEKAVDEALDMVRMRDYKTRLPSQLSSGQQQRVALARALINRPQVLLLDEPLSALDYKLRKEMQTELKRLQRETGITFISVTHDQDEALSMSDRVGVMDAGCIVQLATPEEIYQKPATRFVADFVGICNFIKPEMIGYPAGPEIGFRPEDAVFVTQHFPARIAVNGRVLQISYRGPVTHFLVELDDGTIITVASDDHQPIRLKERVRISISPEHLIKCSA